jgi:hypothetical protein
MNVWTTNPATTALRDNLGMPLIEFRLFHNFRKRLFFFSFFPLWCSYLAKGLMWISRTQAILRLKRKTLDRHVHMSEAAHRAGRLTGKRLIRRRHGGYFNPSPSPILRTLETFLFHVSPFDAFNAAATSDFRLDCMARRPLGRRLLQR